MENGWKDESMDGCMDRGVVEGRRDSRIERWRHKRRIQESTMCEREREGERERVRE